MIREDLLLPLMICSPDAVLEAVGLPSLRSARHSRVAAFVGARHLDLACGSNFLKTLRPAAHIVGLDVQVERPKFDPTVVGRAESLPFVDGTFDSVSMIACLNHFGERDTVIAEAQRVLKPGGLVIVTMIGPLVGLVCHKFRFWYQDTLYRAVHDAEVDGMDSSWVEQLFKARGMACVHEEAFLVRMNRMFLFQKAASPADMPAPAEPLAAGR